MWCPMCGRPWPPDSLSCACGYDFGSADRSAQRVAPRAPVLLWIAFIAATVGGAFTCSTLCLCRCVQLNKQLAVIDRELPHHMFGSHRLFATDAEIKRENARIAVLRPEYDRVWMAKSESLTGAMLWYLVGIAAVLIGGGTSTGRWTCGTYVQRCTEGLMMGMLLGLIVNLRFGRFFGLLNIFPDPSFRTDELLYDCAWWIGGGIGAILGVWGGGRPEKNSTGALHANQEDRDSN